MVIDRSECNLESLIEKANQRMESLDGRLVLPRGVLIDASDGNRYKVREYPSEEIAAEKEEIIQRVAGTILVPVLIGRLGKYLVFEYIHADDARANLGRKTYFAIGRALGCLADYKEDGSLIDVLDIEFNNWLEQLIRVGFLSSQVAAKADMAYQALKPAIPRLCLDYWDVMPHNFGWHGEQLYLLDEKHLRLSFEGVGLIKPSLVLQAQDWDAVLAGYQSVRPTAFFSQQRRFLQLYYLVGALNFYRQKMANGALSIPANPRLRRYYSILLSDLGLSDLSILFERIRFDYRFPRETAYIWRKRIAGRIRRGFGGRL